MPQSPTYLGGRDVRERGQPDQELLERAGVTLVRHPIPCLDRLQAAECTQRSLRPEAPWKRLRDRVYIHVVHRGVAEAPRNGELRLDLQSVPRIACTLECRQLTE